MIKLPTLRSIVASTAIVLMVSLQAAPLALAKTASSAADNIDNLESDLKTVRTNSSYQMNSAFDTSNKIISFFDEINNSIDEVLSEIKSVTPPLNQADFDNLDEAYSSFKKEVNRAISVVNTYSASSNFRNTYTSEKQNTDDNLDDLSNALDKLAEKVTGATTSGATGNVSSSTVQNIISNIDDATTNVKDLNTQAAAVSGSISSLDNFMDDLNNEGDDVLSQLKRINGSISASDLEDLDQAVSDFKKEADKKLTLAGSGSTSYSQSFRDAFKEARDSFRDDYKEKINTQFDRISGLSLGVGVSNSALVNSAVNFIEDTESEVKDMLVDESTINTADKLSNSMEDLISFVNDVETKLKRITGTITQNNFDDLDSAVSSFEKEAKKVRDAFQNNNTSLDFTNEYRDQNTDFKDALSDMNDALSKVEELIGAANTPGATNPNTTFFDVISTSEFYTYITALAARNVVSGYADRSFHPKANVTRAEFLKMALLARGRDISAYQTTASPFVDVASFHALRPYINYAVANNIITGQTINGARYYYPERPISRAEATIILMRITGIAPGSATASRFMDVRDPEQIRYIEVAAAQGVLNGYNANTFGPNDSLTREQAAKIVARINGIVR